VCYLKTLNTNFVSPTIYTESRIQFHGYKAIHSARYIRVIPLANSEFTRSHPLRIELYGCLQNTETGPIAVELL